eukprot:CAMPEP_0114419234 /NCGR_PEP_ID=MMETSP0103-20121206/3919_1 /TAXON_ID=37642 ORGANISM="Paraphysomonas imperforata, Strain PA2" /NCGR_SAMPLE_ID=MMETSP0103 /ASSEMBLY_ACC=CAM_ASM_000201 /LENGTH=1684 /DNA_ID=CAMNT_0001587641 /DNA_START=99 /DNA_END=5150 /DNA_ORIENTATION=-
MKKSSDVKISHSPINILKPAFSLQSLSQDELVKTIASQGKLIGMGLWEINSLVETFQKKNSLRKAYHILLEYSQLHNDIHKLILKRQSYMLKLFSFLQNDDPSQPEFDISHISSKLAEYSVKAWIAICRWRQLQWSPRPIFLSPLASRIPGSGEEPADRNTEPVNVLKMFEDDAAEIFHLTSQRGTPLMDLGVKPAHLIIILATSAANLLSDTAIANAILRPAEVDNCEWGTENPADSHTEREVSILLSPYSEFISAIRAVTQTELSFENVWRTFSSFKGTDPKYQSRNLPVLKLHYDKMTTDVAAQDFSHLYNESCEVLLNFLVRHFSVAPPSMKKKGRVGDLHTSVLRSLATINGESARSRAGSPPRAGTPPYVENNDLSFAEFTSSSPVNQQRKRRPQSSPLVRSIQEPDVDEVTSKEDLLQRSDSPHHDRKMREGTENDVLQPTLANASETPFVSREAFQNDIRDNTKTTVESISEPVTNNESVSDKTSALQVLPQTEAPSPEYVEVDLLVSSANDLYLELRAIENVTQGGKRLLISDFQNFCPAETMDAVNVGDEVIRVAGVLVEGTDTVNVARACTTGIKSAVPFTTFSTVKATLRKRYAGRDLIISKLKNLRSAEEDEVKAISDDDVPAMESALKQLKEAISHFENCMEKAGQQACANARCLIMKKFGLVKTLQYRISKSLAAKVETHKLEVANLERIKLENVVKDAQKLEKSRQEALVQEGLRRQEAEKRERLRNFDDSSAMHGLCDGATRIMVDDVLEEERIDALSYSGKKKKRKFRNKYHTSREERFCQIPRNRPLIATHHFHRHWCSDVTDNSYGFALGVLHLRENNNYSVKHNHASTWVVSNTIKHALRRIEVKGKGISKTVLAARKLGAWWELIYPQKVLAMRMQIKTMVLDIVEEMVLKSFKIGAASTKRRILMMRSGAATVIQRVFRKWKSTVLMHVIFIQKVCKRFLTRLKVLRLVNVVRAAVLVARFLYRRKIRLRKIVGKRVHYKRVIRNYLDHIGYLNRDTNQTAIMQMISNNNKLASFVDSKQSYMVKRRLDAIIKIQSFFRMLAAQWYHKYLVQEDYICKKVRCAMKILQLRRKILNKRKLRIAAVKMQRTWRGCASRWKLYLQVIAGIKITAAWRKYRQYWKLKQCLRRIEVPVEIVLHGIRNIAAQLIYSRKIKVRVSVWWNSLLHLVDNKDFMTITQSKQPHIIRTTNFYDCEQMPEKVLPAISTLTNKISLPPPVTGMKNRGGKRLSLVAQAQKINVGAPNANENSLTAFVARQSQKKASPALKGIVKKSMLTGLAITPINGGESDEESESSSDSSSSSSCSDTTEDGDFQDDVFADKTSSVGRGSGLGSNLLTAGTGSASEISLLPPLSLPPDFSPGDRQSPAPRRPTMTRVSRTDASTGDSDGLKKTKKPFGKFGATGSTVNLINKGLFGFSNAFKQAQIRKKEEEEKKNATPKAASLYQCNLNEETLYIPGCHGNAVIRFDLFDGDRKFGSNLFQLSEDKKLLFWGGEYKREVTVTKIRRAVQLGGNTIKQTERNRLVKHEETPILDVRVVSGAALRSKCGWALVSIRGTGPVKRRLRAKGGFTKIFDGWDRGYLSMDGANLFCYTSKNAPNPWVVIPLSDIKSIHIELNALSKIGDSGNKKKSAPTEDKFDVVVTSSTRDIFHFKFPGSSARENW